MTKPIERDVIYRGRRYSAETIELCVRWYITYRLSYRDLAAMMAERDVIVSHTIVQRIFRSFLAVAPIRFSSHRETAVRSARPKAGQKLRVFMLLPLASPGSAAGP